MNLSPRRLFGRQAQPDHEDNEGGFSLVELVLATGMAAFVFAALAGLLGNSLKVLSVSKARTQGNEVATQGMEELQRLGYNALGLCASPPNPPAEFQTLATPLNCPNPVPAGYGEDPCNTTTAGVGVPKPTYSCVRNGVTYNVRRYVAWGDAGRTSKRMAVFVTWRDPVGFHEVSQQSSLRAPGQADIFGLDPPIISTVSVSDATTVVRADDPSTAENEAGLLPTSTAVTLVATTVNLASDDKVFAVFNTVDADGNPVTSSRFLTSVDGKNWNASITSADGFRFGVGSQFFSFGAIRNADGKANSAFPGTANKFCTPTDSTCSSSALPRFEGAVEAWPSPLASVIGVDSGGALKADSITLRATTKNATAADTVTVSFQTSAGAVSTALQVEAPCDTTSNTCTWTGAVSKASGYSFATGSRPFYFSVVKVGGSTGAQASDSKDFVLQ